MERIEGKVARILNRRELVLNVGSAAGVRPHMRFAVLNPRGAAIRDPDSGEDLGSVEIPKVIVEAIRVNPRLTVARTFKTLRKNVGGEGGFTQSAIMRLFEPPKYIEYPEDLRTDEGTYKEELDERESYVKTGDPAVQILSDEFDTEE